MKNKAIFYVPYLLRKNWVDLLSKYFGIILSFNYEFVIYSAFQSVIVDYAYISEVHKPTRVTAKTTTLINNIFTNAMLYLIPFIKKGLIKSIISDQFLIFVVINNSKHKQKQIKETF